MIKSHYVSSVPNRLGQHNYDLMEKFCLSGNWTEEAVKCRCFYKLAPISLDKFFPLFLTQLGTLGVLTGNK
jgi:hypothetical protein